MEMEEDYQANLENLFDIAHVDALKIMTIEADKELLINQRKLGNKRELLEKKRREELRPEVVKMKLDKINTSRPKKAESDNEDDDPKRYKFVAEQRKYNVNRPSVRFE